MSKRGVVMIMAFVAGKIIMLEPPVESKRTGLDIPAPNEGSVSSIKVPKCKGAKKAVADKGKKASTTNIIAGSPSRLTRISTKLLDKSTACSPSRLTKSTVAVHKSSVIVSSAPVSVAKKTLGVKRKLSVRRKVVEESVKASETPPYQSTQQSTALAKPPWKPTGSSLTHDVRFSTGKDMQQPIKKQFVKEGEQVQGCAQH